MEGVDALNVVEGSPIVRGTVPILVHDCLVYSVVVYV